MLVACSLPLVSCLRQAWRLQLLTIDPNPGAESLPVIGHDLELSCDGLQLARASVAYFYSKLFHII